MVTHYARGAGHLRKSQADAICAGLSGILEDLESGRLAIDPAAEDIHMFIEAELTARLGDAGKRLHTARSRNDQVALDIRLYLRDEIDAVTELVEELLRVLCNLAKEHADTVMSGYTHLQRAQPVSFGHHLMAYAQMLLRDRGRLSDCKKRMDDMPLGSCALAADDISHRPGPRGRNPWLFSCDGEQPGRRFRPGFLH